MQTKKTMTLNLTDEEMQMIEALARQKDVSKTAIVKSAIRLFHVISSRMANGEKIFTEDAENGEKAELLFL